MARKRPSPPHTYTYQVEGVQTIGTLDDYAKAWKQWYYSSIHLSPTVRDGDGTQHRVHVVERSRDAENDNLYFKLSVNGETAHVTIDGRA